MSARTSILLLGLFALRGSIFAQNDRGTITGVITDPSGSVTPSVQVVATNEGTQIQTSTITGAAGTYTIPALPIGNYTVAATLAGFKTYVRTAVPVQVSETTRIW